MSKTRTAEPKGDQPAKKKGPDDGTRETIESIAMAVILALIFRAFVAEAFVIPTGSMAPTLQGRHKDVACQECGLWYQTGASNESNSDGSPTGRHVIGTMCPNCRYPQTLDLYNQPNEDSFSGDRIIVSKFAYGFAEPQRWDVIVFKFPGNARDNYIKRLVGLPGETIRIEGGNIYVKKGDEPFRIARKPPPKLNVLMQLVHDSDHPSAELNRIGWPTFWYAQGTGPDDVPVGWTEAEDGRSFTFTPSETQTEGRIRYRHVPPTFYDWEQIVQNKQLPKNADLPGRLIADMYAYNAGHSISIFPQSYSVPQGVYDPQLPLWKINPRELMEEALGQHWVDDLAVQCTAEVQSASGELILEVIRAGSKYQAAIDVATGQAKLSIADAAGSPVEFEGDDGVKAREPTATTSVRGPGTYTVRLSNIDHELLLWVNGSVVPFQGPTTYSSPALVAPQSTEADPGDLQPGLVGARGLAVKLSKLQIYRDKYYIATKRESDDYVGLREDVGEVFSNPELWAETRLFTGRRAVEFALPEDAFMPLGDNSPYSKDARLWAEPHRTSPIPPYEAPVPHYVKRELLVGKALMVYWPHSWNRPYGWPHFSRMGLIR